ncbi:MAG: transcriptional repressor [Lachnospiraceae bacterium]|nr:transcriptional repressor [Lachnospiraceae bacterium]
MNSRIHQSSYDEIIEKHWPEDVKKTRQRVAIYRVLYASAEPLSAAEIYNSLEKDSADEPYAFSTIYRNLLAFEKAGIVTKNVLSTEDNALYELKKETHKHYAVCLSCHKKFPIKSCPLHEITHDLEKDLPDFKVTGHQLEIYGYCNECANQVQLKQ